MRDRPNRIDTESLSCHDADAFTYLHLRSQPSSISMVRFSNQHPWLHAIYWRRRTQQRAFDQPHCLVLRKDGVRVTTHNLKDDSNHISTVSSDISNSVISPVHEVVTGRSGANKPQNVTSCAGTRETTTEAEGNFI